MAAGLGFKDFVTGEVLTAADVDGYLMQGVWVFASAAARDAAVTSPQEGNFAYLKDTNVTTYYTGSAWANLDTTGMTNPMTTTGDTIYSSSGSTPARLGIGTVGQVLTVNSGATAPEWATPAGGGGMTVLASGSMPTGANVLDLQSISGSYKDLQLVIRNARFTGAYAMDIRVNNQTGSIYNRMMISGNNTTFNSSVVNNTTAVLVNYDTMTNGSEPATIIVDFPDYANTTSYKIINVQAYYESHDNTGVYSVTLNFAGIKYTDAIDRITTVNGASTVSAGTYILYGIK